MRLTVLAALAVLALAACSKEDPKGGPPVETLYAIQGTNIVCDGTAEQWGTSSDGRPPFTRYSCSWSNVNVGGAPKCWAVALFARPNGAADWEFDQIVALDICN